MLTFQVTLAAACAIASIASGSIVPTTLAGSAHIAGYTTADGVDRDEYDLTNDLSVYGLSLDLAESATAATALSEATASSGTQLIPGGLRAFSTNYGRGSIGSQGGNAVGTSRTLMTIRFTSTSDDPITITGVLSGGQSDPGGRSYFGDGVVKLYNPAGGIVLRLNAMSTGSTVAEIIGSPMPGEWRLELEATAGAFDYGGGGFSGGWVTGAYDISVTSVPGPGPAALLAMAAPLAARRRR
ncbi:MAG: hypothetical protein IT436_18675 [Phycisphaerales bacterium]|nr:hypothetical protein [Phycisphaerales bacterium]